MLFLYLTLIGLLSGTFIGMIGVGAGVIMVPLMVAVGLNVYQATGITLAMQTIPVGIFGFLRYYKHGHIDIPNASFVAVGMLCGIAFGAYFANLENVSEKQLKYLLGTIAVGTGIYTLYKA